MSAFQGIKVLLVDDEEIIREILREEFENLGAQVFEAEDGQSALRMVIGHPVDVIVSDHRMPGGSGLDFLKQVPRTSLHRPVFLLVSGQADFGTREAYNEGVTAFLGKPFDMNKILDIVGAALPPRQEAWSQARMTYEGTPLEMTFASLSTAQASGQVSIGRGGLYLSSSEATTPAQGARLNFTLRFEAENVLLKGVGQVQWRSPKASSLGPSGFGLEILTVEDPGLTWLLSYLESSRPRAYIPNR